MHSQFFHFELDFMQFSKQPFAAFLNGDFLLILQYRSARFCLLFFLNESVPSEPLCIVGFLVGFCLNMGQNWPGLKLPLVPQLRPRHGGFLASFYFLSSNVVFCFTCCFFCCFSTALASFSNMRQKNGFTLKEWGSSNAWYFRPIHLYLKNQA